MFGLGIFFDLISYTEESIQNAYSSLTIRLLK